MQIRIIILGVILLAFMSLGLVAYHYKVSARDAVAAKEAAERSLSTALDVNADNEKTMTALEAAKAKSDKLAADLAAEVDTANQSALAVARTLADLRMKNADVDSYLRGPVPADLQRLYDGVAAGSH